MNPRNPEQIQADIVALGRPPFSALAAIARQGEPDPALEEWRVANPRGDDAFDALMAELNAAEAWVAAQSVSARIARAWARSSGLGPQTLDCLEAPKSTAALEWVREWRSKPACWLLLMGGPGTGKSVAAAWAMREAVLRGESARYVPAASLMRLATFDGEGEALASVQWLAIDDVGVEYASNFASSVWQEVLSRRAEGQLRTCLTTNLDAQALRQRLGVRLADRVRSSVITARLVGNSMRAAP